MSSNSFFHVTPLTADPCHLNDNATAEAERTWLCTGCLSPKPGCGAIDVRIQEMHVADPPLNFVAASGVSMALRSFLDRLGNDLVRRDLWIGRVFGPDGEEVKEWCTWRGRQELIVRGSKDVGCRRCPECGRILYFALGRPYLYPEPPQDIELFESQLGLVLPERLFARLELRRRKHLGVEKLPVLAEPLDGLGELV